ncbi:MAG: nitroreductase family deazaflavin-dependent oxidoreductase [Actinomycetota bacterium]|nr:nitroreductase family deazaflavin-dependent oxidoreductase [Actinomycetota bacterium]
MVLPHTKGAKSGNERINPLVFLPDDADPSTCYIFASKAGAPRNPDWYTTWSRIRGSPSSRPRKLEATASELHGAQRDEVYATAAATIACSRSLPHCVTPPSFTVDGLRLITGRRARYSHRAFRDCAPVHRPRELPGG